MKQRIISALIMLPLLIFIYVGGLPLLLMTFLIAVLGLYEFYRGYSGIGVKADMFFGFALSVMLYIIVYYGEFAKGKEMVYAHLMLLWVFLTTCIGLVVSLFRKDHNILDGAVTSLGVFYVPFCTVHVVLVNQLPRYNHLIWIIFLAAFGSDIFAYFTGYFFGRHKLCPNISPKKTIEGAVGGVLGSMILCSVFTYLVYPDLIIHGLIIGFIGSFFAMAGDLSASAIKRKVGIKDYGNLIPGHGGILDRFDSVLLVAPFVYYYTIIFIKP